MKRFLLPVIALIACLAGPRVDAATPGESVVIVYNRNAKESKEVAEHYAERRGVPKKQIVGLSMPNAEEISRADYRRDLERPLWRFFENEKLFTTRRQTVNNTNLSQVQSFWNVVQSPIRYVVLSYGVPLRIQNDPSIEEAIAPQINEALRKNTAAVENELAVLPLFDLKLPLVGWMNNQLYRATNGAVFHPTNGVLMVSRLDGPSPAIARSLVDKAIAAETNGLWGRVYIDSRNIRDGAYKPGDDWMRFAATVSKEIGFETIHDERPETFPVSFPMSTIAFYAGWYDTHASGPFTRAVVEFVPGAFAYHLHSGSGTTVRDPSRHWVAPLLAAGATCTMGSVDEPYLIGTPDIGLFFANFFGRGMTFGEAAYSSMLQYSWMTTVVGDPLYRPFREDAMKQIQETIRDKKPGAEWAVLRLVNRVADSGKPLIEVTAMLEADPFLANSAVLLEKLGDLYQQLGKPSSSIDAWQRALKQNPSLQQTIRLKLGLVAKLTEATRTDEAVEAYGDFLKGFPDYVDRLTVLRSAKPLADKAGKKDLASAWQKEIDKLAPPPPAPVTNAAPAVPVKKK